MTQDGRRSDYHSCIEGDSRAATPLVAHCSVSSNKPSCLNVPAVSNGKRTQPRRSDQCTLPM